MAACALPGLSKLTNPKHLLWLVARSMKTLELITFPKGRNICMSSASPNSWGRWQMKRLQPSGPLMEQPRNRDKTTYRQCRMRDLTAYLLPGMEWLGKQLPEEPEQSRWQSSPALELEIILVKLLLKLPHHTFNQQQWMVWLSVSLVGLF